MTRQGLCPMDSDKAEEIQKEFLSFGKKKIDGLRYFIDWERMFLKDVTLEELKIIANKEFISKNRFVIPYTFRYCGIRRTDLEEFFKDCLDYHEALDSEETIKTLEDYKRNFRKIMKDIDKNITYLIDDNTFLESLNLLEEYMD